MRGTSLALVAIVATYATRSATGFSGDRSNFLAAVNCDPSLGETCPSGAHLQCRELLPLGTHMMRIVTRGPHDPTRDSRG